MSVRKGGPEWGFVLNAFTIIAFWPNSFAGNWALMNVNSSRFRTRSRCCYFIVVVVTVKLVNAVVGKPHSLAAGHTRLTSRLGAGNIRRSIGSPFNIIQQQIACQSTCNFYKFPVGDLHARPAHDNANVPAPAQVSAIINSGRGNCAKN